jgi:Ca2+-binding RTX toxin-like protein
MKARVDQNDWQVYDENLTDGNYNYARSWLAREAALMYQLTGDQAYADIAFDALFAIHNTPDPDNRLPESGDGLARAMVGMGFAIAYDWARSGWTQEQQDYIRDRITTALDNWPSYSHPNLSSPWGSNWVAVTRSAELVMMLAVEEETIRGSRYESLKDQLRQHLETGYGPTGWTQEGNGYLAYGGGFLLAGIHALQSVGDSDLNATFNTIDFWQLPMYAGAFDESQTAMQFGVGWTRFDPEGWTSMLLGLTPEEQLPYYRYFYDHFRGLENPASDGAKFDHARAGTTWSLIYYPTDVPSTNPTDSFAPVLADNDKGAFFFRDRWQDENDILVSIMGDYEWHEKAWDQSEVFSLGLHAYNTHFIGGPDKEREPEYFSNLLVNGAVGAEKTTGAPDFFAATETGGYVIVDGGQTYQTLGVESAQRHLLVDFSGDAGRAVLSTLDQVRDTDTNTYTWQLNLGDARGNLLGITDIYSGSENGLSYFVVEGDNDSYLKGWVVNADAVSIVAGDPLQVTTSGSNTDLWVVMVLGSGVIPEATVTGSGLDAMLDIGNSRIRYDASTNRIVSEFTGTLVDVVGTSADDNLVGNAGANLLTGGLGIDNLTGQSGSDGFVYQSPAEGGDAIADFGVDDYIQLSATGFGAGLISNIPLIRVDANTFTQPGSNATFTYQNGILSFDPDGAGGESAEAIAILSGNPRLAAHQLVVVE